MAGVDEIERLLGERLIPRGFTDRGSEAMDALIDDLAAEEDSSGRRRWPWAAVAAAVTGGIAAVICWPTGAPSDAPAVLAQAPDEAVELLSESVGVISAEADDELRSDDEGNLLRAWHLQVVSEERFRDAETGHEVRVVQPSDELVLVPVSTF